MASVTFFLSFSWRLLRASFDGVFCLLNVVFVKTFCRTMIDNIYFSNGTNLRVLPPMFTEGVKDMSVRPTVG